MTTFTDQLSAALLDAITLKFNPNHDELGRFSEGGGSGGGGGSSGGGAPDIVGALTRGLSDQQISDQLFYLKFGVPRPRKTDWNKPTKKKTPKAPKGAFDYKPGEYNPFLNGGRGGIVSKKP